MKFFKENKLIAFLIIQIILVRILALFPELIEQFYSNGIYQYHSNFFRKVLGSIGFSVGDVIYIALIGWIIFLFIKHRKNITIKYVVISFLKGFSVFYFFFHLLWGMNYYRIPLSEKMQLTYDHSFDELLTLTDELIQRSNEIQFQITKNDSVKVVIPYSNQEIYNLTKDSYNRLNQFHSEFNYSNPAIKNSIISLPLTYMGFGGYMNPFTGEAQVNSLLPKMTFPTVALHEISHQMGYASESEANLIGYLASVASDNIYFKYSGTIYALRYCLRNIEKEDEVLLEKYLSKLNYGIRLNFQENKEFWDSYQTPIEIFFEFFYDNFLKANDQDEGLQTYSKFIGLLISYQKAQLPLK